MTRRDLLLALLALPLAACARQAQTPAPAESPDVLPNRDAWIALARGVLVEALGILHTFDQFTVFRSSNADGATGLVPADPPTSAAWGAASAGLQSVAARANDAYASVAHSDVSDANWRARRGLAEEMHLLVAVTDALTAYRAAVDHLPAGQDASTLLPLLQGAWNLWVGAAEQWQVNRFESLGC
jgi:hypothetical protein